MSSLPEGRVQRAFSLPSAKRLSTAAAIVLFAAMGLGSLQAATIDVTKSPYNASTNGTTDDTTAINNAISAASSAGGGVVEFPSGKYLTGSVHLKSNVTLQLDSGSTILGNSGKIDAGESENSSYSSYQDYGHDHFHDALIWGDGLTNVGITGSGTIDGNGALATSQPGSGKGDKGICFKQCDGVLLSGFTLKNGGWFGLFTQGTNNIVVTGISIKDSNQRDAFDLVNAQHVDISDSDIEGSDDSMCLKATYALGPTDAQGNTWVNRDIHVDHCTILSTGNNAVQFGSETVFNFYDCTFTHLTITKAGKAGLGMTSNDGSIMDGVTFSDITLTGCVTPIWLKITDNHRKPSSYPGPVVGKIRNVSFTNITGSGNGSTTSTIEGCGTVSPAVTIDNIVFNNVKLTVPGGGSAGDASNTPPTDNNWQPRYLGTAPSYGFFLRHMTNVSFTGCNFGFSSNDNRPALKCDNDGANLKIDSLTYQKGSGRPYDLGFVNVAGYQVTNSGTPTISASGSTTATITAAPIFTPYSGTYSSGQTVTLASATSGASIRYTTDDSTPTATTGTAYSGPITLTADMNIRAIATVSGSNNSAVNTAIYTVTGSGPPPPPVVADPTFNPSAGTYTSAPTITISDSTAGASIHYTTDGSTPSETAGTLYSSPFAISASGTTTIKAIAFKSGSTDSNVVTATYTVSSTPQAAAPVFSPAPGTYGSAQNVAITSTTGGASIHYTTDGSTPSETAGTLYSGPVNISNTSSATTLKAIAFESGFTDSTVTSGTYTITTGGGNPVPVTLEAENLSPVGTGATVSISNDTNASGGVIEFLNSTAAGQSITFTTPSIVAGTYQLQIRYKPNTSRGQFTTTVDGTAVGGTVDEYSTSQTYVTATLGTVTIADGAHTIILTVAGKNASASQFYVTADTFTFTPTTGGGGGPAPTVSFEAENLTYTPSGATASVQTDTNSSNGKWVELAGNSVGDSISYAIPSMVAGTYQVQMEWKGNNSRGIVQLAVDGTNVGPTLDQYASGQTYPTTTFGTVTFASAGTHTVKLTVTGKNGSSSNYQISSDKFTFVGQ
ncbi:MAG TPA: chitobiase/beta-hexosaminidase C-terminal domain-containing protein [Opitutaceae bacterium]|nr:chitobiase/beta-hexosaminidase C-terminal domain-containing protein [Opitutaceae bacterium]